jgi:hypothetical protein
MGQKNQVAHKTRLLACHFFFLQLNRAWIFTFKGALHLSYFLALAHEARDLFPAKTKIALVKSCSNLQNDNIYTQNDDFFSNLTILTEKKINFVACNNK